MGKTEPAREPFALNLKQVIEFVGESYEFATKDSYLKNCFERLGKKGLELPIVKWLWERKQIAKLSMEM